MPKREKPTTTTVNGVDVVLLTPGQHAGLESARRQLGGAQAHVARMRLDLRRSQHLLGEAERVLAHLPADQAEAAGGHLADGRGIADLLADIRATLPRTPDFEKQP
ncbi:hypothetical protein ACGF07_07800 [Kitasatospora sp. NPDC048194]|uniref:hypothetical protein n=1 Tax=Kitasatospora sp. NPDC048194 TaxID=3364045 RepID=UPI0037178978